MDLVLVLQELGQEDIATGLNRKTYAHQVYLLVSKLLNNFLQSKEAINLLNSLEFIAIIRKLKSPNVLHV